MDLGFESKLPTLETMLVQPDVSVLIFIDIQLSFELGSLGWNLDQGNVWTTSFDASKLKMINNPLDIVDVVFMQKNPSAIDQNSNTPQLDNGIYGFHLRRAESVAECRSTPGSFYINTNYPGLKFWDDGATKWDLAPKAWDNRTGLIYIYLPSAGTTDTSENPNDYIISARGQVSISNGPEVSPILYPGINSSILNGGFENGLTSWTTSATSGVVVSASTDEKLKGATSAKIESDGGTVNPSGNVRQTRTTIPGNIYRVSGAYYIDPDSEDTWNPYIAVSNAGATDGILTDGRNLKGSFAFHLMIGDKGRWYNFKFDYIAWETSTLLTFYGYNGGGGSSPEGKIYYDDIAHQVISRYESYDGRFETESLPEVSGGTQGTRFGTKQTSSLDVTLDNTDKELFDTFRAENIVGAINVTPLGAEVSIDVGYSAQDTGEMPRESFEKIFLGTVNRMFSSTNGDKLVFHGSDFRSVFQNKLPPNIASEDDFQNADERNWGKPIPMLFGQKNHIIPILLDVISGDSRNYFNDPSFTTIYDTALLNQGAHLALWCYTSDNFRSQQDTSKRFQTTQSGGADTQAFTQRGAVIPTNDLIAIEILDGGLVTDRGMTSGSKQNNAIDFKFNDPAPPTTVREAFMPAGIYTISDAFGPSQGFIQTLQAQMRAAAGATTKIFVDYNTFAVRKVTIYTSPAIIFEVLVKTGVNGKIGIYKVAGQSEAADGTGLSQYIAQNQMWTSAKEHEIFAIQATGYIDDSLGTWTGAADALITKGVDIIRFIAAKVYGLDTSRVFDNDTLNSFRSHPNTYNLGIYLDKQVSGINLMEAIEISDFSEFIMDGGKISARFLNDATVNHTIKEEDIVAYEMEETAVEVVESVELEFDVSISRRSIRRRRRGRGRVNSNRVRALRRESYVIDTDEAFLTANRIADLSDKFSIYHKITAFGSLVRARYADRAQINFSDMFGDSPKEAKLIQFSKNYIERTTRAVLLEE